MRGNLAGLDGNAVQVGSIPACAGEPRPSAPSATPRGVYPRVCGGTRRRAGHPGQPAVYPRVCGGTRRRAGPATWRGGLSPRVRGNPGENASPASGRRSIPTCAGEPRSHRFPYRPGWVYPRVCGGTRLAISGERLGDGLSPRVRGNQRAHADPQPGTGSIPACAGEPLCRRRKSGRRMVYPRVCGGTTPGKRAGAAVGGLSPRVRGNSPRQGQPRQLRRSIPACAGEPPEYLLDYRPTGVYPRVCGGTV